jgi:outer membrane protein assembly factor BamA
VKHSILCFFLVIIHSLVGVSQTNLTVNDTVQENVIIIKQLILIGNKKTKSHIIKRELTFNQGDTIILSDTNAVFTRSRNNVFNTELFIAVTSEIFTTDSLHYLVILKVKERWYLWPIPIVELADRNFNEWVQERGADLSRINIGIDFKQENFRGRNEELHIKLQAGFTKKYELFYTIPYIDKKRKTGFKVFASYSTNKIVAFETSKNKLQYYESNDIMRKRFYGGFAIIRRSKLYSKHEISLRYKENHISDSILDLNPNYFLDSRKSQQYFQLKYRFQYDKRDIKYYALKGHVTKLELKQSGLGIFDDIAQFESYLSHARYYPLNKKFFFSTMVKGKFSVPQKQPYFNNRALGYDENFVRGYELYVVDGQKYAFNRNELKFKIYDRTTHLESYMGDSPFSTVPLQIYLKTYVDLGWAIDHSYGYLNPLLNDRLLSGIGMGIDFVTFYDAVFRLEYSYNHLNEHGFFLHIGASI